MNISKKIINRYKKLIKTINNHNLLYHTYDSPEISDNEYDSLYSEIKEIENLNPTIISSNSPTQRVGSTLLENFEKRQHETPMLSLSNASTFDDFHDFYKKLLNESSLASVTLFAEPKFDGLAVSITYKNGEYHNATTRGDGFIGEDVTQNVKTIKALPIVIDNSKLPKNFSVRGEVFIDKKDFEKINKDLRKKGEKEYSNARNLAAGSIRQLDPAIASSRRLRLFIHGIDDPEKFTKFKHHDKLFLHFADIGFPVNNYSRLLYNINDSSSYFDEMDSLRNQIPYEIDGLVYRVNDLAMYKKLGFTAKSPKWAIAYKFKSLEALSRIKEVTFQVGRTGTITPVAELLPVNIGGVNVSRATLHNFSEISSKDIHLNDYVYVKRAGDVIPDIDRVELSKRKNVTKIRPPKNCPSCGSVLKKIDDQVAYKCLNHKNCTPQIEQSIIHFISRKAMNIQGIGNQIIKDLVSKKIISRSSDLYKLSRKDFENLDRVGDKSISNYLSSIESSKETTLSKFIYSLGIKEVGESSSRSIATRYKSVDNFLSCNYDELIQVEDVGPIVANNIISYLSDKDNIKNINALVSADIKLIDKETPKMNNITAVLTGSFENYSRTDLTEILENNGYKIAKSLSKNTNILICGDKPGNKLAKAKDYGIEIIYESELIKLLSKFH